MIRTMVPRLAPTEVARLVQMAGYRNTAPFLSVRTARNGALVLSVNTNPRRGRRVNGRGVGAILWRVLVTIRPLAVKWWLQGRRRFSRTISVACRLSTTAFRPYCCCRQDGNAEPASCPCRQAIRHPIDQPAIRRGRATPSGRDCHASMRS